jgi:hypothetical protein
MATILIRKSDWDALTPERRTALQEMTAAPMLGEPALGTLDGVEWCAFDDDRITTEQVDLVAVFMANPELLDGP